MVTSKQTIPKRLAAATLRARGKKIRSRITAKTIVTNIRITMKRKGKVRRLIFIHLDHISKQDNDKICNICFSCDGNFVFKYSLCVVKP